MIDYYITILYNNENENNEEKKNNEEMFNEQKGRSIY